MFIRIRVISAMLSAFALCSCATTASPPLKSIVASGNCTERTASNNTLANNSCITTGKRSYSQTDLQSTGKTSVGDALALLDPALTVKH
jgi:hypothetical protein